MARLKLPSFTLIETLVAMLILSGIISLGIGIFFNTTRNASVQFINESKSIIDSLHQSNNFPIGSNFENERIRISAIVHKAESGISVIEYQVISNEDKILHFEKRLSQN